MNLARDLSDLAGRQGWLDRPAVHTATRPWTYGEVHAAAARAATVLAERGAGPGRRLLIALPDDIGWVVAFLACVRVGATAVPVNPALPAQDHAFMAGDSGADLAITTPELADRAPEGGRIDIAGLLDSDAAPAPAVDTDEPLYIHYTSGTTGRPKGVPHRHRDPAIYHRTIGRDCLRLTPEDVTLSISKLYFTYGFCNSFVFPFHSGSSVVLAPDRLTPAAAAELVARHGVTRLYAVPSWLATMVADGPRDAFASVRYAVAGGERLTAELARQAADVLGAPVLNQLGATEIGCAATANTVEHDVAGTIGRPVPEFEVRVADAHGRPVRDGVEGEMWVRGPTVMAGYLGLPDATAAVLRDGWLLTRDRVVRNADGTFTHVRRADDMEIVGGITLSPLEIEDVLGAHRDVREVAVAAVPDDTGATKLRAFVIPAGDPPAARLATELIGLARAKLAAFKVPRSVHLVRDLPRTASGKLRRHTLRQRVIRSGEETSCSDSSTSD
jgi:acyl-coenzyme A synthetase/AMP-(fatty) acid ligase